MNWFHSHQWRVTGAHKLDKVTRHIVLGEVHSPITEVLRVCGCGAVETVELDGHWSLEQLQPKETGMKADRKFLQQLGIDS